MSTLGLAWGSHWLHLGHLPGVGPWTVFSPELTWSIRPASELVDTGLSKLSNAELREFGLYLNLGR